jgi:hypothetical protein
MKAKITRTKSGKGAFVEIIESDDEIEARDNRLRELSNARRQRAPYVAITTSTDGNAAVQGGQ